MYASENIIEALNVPTTFKLHNKLQKFFLLYFNEIPFSE